MLVREIGEMLGGVDICVGGGGGGSLDRRGRGTGDDDNNDDNAPTCVCHVGHVVCLDSTDLSRECCDPNRPGDV